jgi:hypothetical protein
MQIFAVLNLASIGLPLSEIREYLRGGLRTKFATRRFLSC